MSLPPIDARSAADAAAAAPHAGRTDAADSPLAASAAALVAVGAVYSATVARSKSAFAGHAGTHTHAHILSFLSPDALTRAACVSTQWRDAVYSEPLWKALCRALVSQYHPNPLQGVHARVWERAIAHAYTHTDIGTHEAALAVAARPLAYGLSIAASRAGTTGLETAFLSMSEAERVLENAHTHERARDRADAEATEGQDDRDARRVAALLAAVRMLEPLAAPPPVSQSRPREEDEEVHADGDAGDAEASLSIEQQALIEVRTRARDAVVRLRDEAVSRRAHTVGEWRTHVARLGGSYRLALRWLPLVRPHGAYVLRHEYIRKGVNDMWHPSPGILRVVYHRNFWFHENGTCVYTMMPGEAADGLREMRKHRSAHAWPGWYVMSGACVCVEVFGGGGIVTRWTMRVDSRAGYNNRLVVESLLLLEHGADAGAVTPMTQLEGEEFVYLPVRAWA